MSNNRIGMDDKFYFCIIMPIKIYNNVILAPHFMCYFMRNKKSEINESPKNRVTKISSLFLHFTLCLSVTSAFDKERKVTMLII